MFLSSIHIKVRIIQTQIRSPDPNDGEPKDEDPKYELPKCPGESEPDKKGLDMDTIIIYSIIAGGLIIVLDPFSSSFVGGNDMKHKEVRGVWVATVNNIDIPRFESIEQYQREFTKILDTMESYNMTDVFFQVRPCNDAFYRSSLNPWSEFLTGAQGKDPGWDPLPWLIETSHQRGIQFHAWLNPYRITGKKVGEDAPTKNGALEQLILIILPVNIRTSSY